MTIVIKVEALKEEFISQEEINPTQRKGKETEERIGAKKREKREKKDREKDGKRERKKE